MNNGRYSLTATSLTRRIQALGIAAGVLFCATAQAQESPARAYILQYHHISDDTPRSTSTTPELFRQHMQFIADNGYQVLPLAEIIRTLQEGDSLPEKTVALTFDDGYKSIYETAYPLLKERGYPFTIFLNPDALDNHRSTHITWEQAREMGKHGGVVANHGVGHIHMVEVKTNEDASAWRARITQNIEQAEKRIEEETGASLKLLAYPYGEYDASLQKLVSSLGYVGLGQHSGPIGPDSDWTSLPRFPASNAYSSVPQLKEKLSTLPLPAQMLSPQNILIADNNPPQLRFSTELNAKVTCYGSGQGLLDSAVDNNEVTVVGAAPFKGRRFRYNCTAPAGGGLFYWRSFPWINPAVPED
ncbi:hypothetical protein EUZ85_12840 [Hahella sp. KA22]|uniref:polysaccharide deacetylase family protein n=1 Tax=Hahella sp. KA22 TaxID=1628392 RepID=UPI000FDDB151|nr:polysaccharide deacetylase family protein [Hahella sp. KA22]AZZ91562.1 hypothetical protein ENC22_10280 [Hahella sp. KA22]QAY54932.1 hypothetical protein EUZ85_12840 [Hahella sp. KA22]